MIKLKGDTTVIGLKGSGKSYASKKILRLQECGVLYFNTKQETEDLKAYYKINGDKEINYIIKALKKGLKLNFVPADDDEFREKQLKVLIDRLLGAGFTEKNYIYLAVDEVHLYKKEGLKACIKLATIGRSKGVRAFWISQRGAKIDNTLMSQSEQFLIFKNNMESNYYEGYSIPNTEIQEKLKGKPYHFCKYDFNSLQGPYKI